MIRVIVVVVTLPKLLPHKNRHTNAYFVRGEMASEGEGQPGGGAPPPQPPGQLREDELLQISCEKRLVTDSDSEEKRETVTQLSPQTTKKSVFLVFWDRSRLNLDREFF